MIADAPRRFRLGRAAGSKHKITQQAITGGTPMPKMKLAFALAMSTALAAALAAAAIQPAEVRPASCCCAAACSARWC